MAINIRCQDCKSDLKTGTKKCPKCGAIVSRNKKYRVIVRVNGIRVTRSVDNLELAKDVEARFKTDIARGELRIKKAKAVTIDELWAKYLPWIKANKKTWRDDEYNFNRHLRPAFGPRRLDAISPFLIESFIVKMKKGESRRGTPYALATIKHQLVLLTRLYSVAEKWGIYSGDNPCRKVKKPRLNNQVTEFLNDDELGRLLDALRNWPNRMSAGFVLFCLHTGLRRGELFRLTWGDISFNQCTVTLRSPKGKIDQTLPLSGKAIEVLKTLPREFDTPWVFYGKGGGKRTDFKGPWLKIKKAAGLPDGFRLHGLRHHFASSLVSAGVDLYTVQKLLCHKDSSMTQRYAHLSDKALRDAVNLSDTLLGPTKITGPKTLRLVQNAK